MNHLDCELFEQKFFENLKFFIFQKAFLHFITFLTKNCSFLILYLSNSSSNGFCYFIILDNSLETSTPVLRVPISRDFHPLPFSFGQPIRSFRLLPCYFEGKWMADGSEWHPAYDPQCTICHCKVIQCNFF